MRQARRLAGLGTALALAITVSPALSVSLSGPAVAEERRRVVSYVVRPGDTATELAVRFHAWTAELLALNGLTRQSTLYVGQRLRIPVVPPALRDGAPARRTERKPASEPARAAPELGSGNRVARVVVRTARRQGVDARLALAVAWQESGWRMQPVSSAGAIGAMQVLPSTGTWMSLYVGRPLHLHLLRDNVTAGVTLLRVLRDHTETRRHKIAAYYQGLGAVQRHGLYEETRRYVANVLALRRMIIQGRELQ